MNTPYRASYEHDQGSPAHDPAPYGHDQGSSAHEPAPQGRFFVIKHLVLFMVMVLSILIIDLMLYISIAIFEEAQPVSDPSPLTILAELADSVVPNDKGEYHLADNQIKQDLTNNSCWAAMVNEKGTVVWTYHEPEDFPTHLSNNDIALIAHNHAYEDTNVFIRTDSENQTLLLLGYPKGQYAPQISFNFSTETFERLPLYFLIVFVIDLLIVFALYALSQRSIINKIGPTINALDNLAQGKPATVHFGGLLAPISQRINKASDTLIRKETARKNWVAGVSHDVRTPLAIIMGYAERLEHDPNLSKEAQKSAHIIMQQGIRIRDLVEDLNIATQLEYDMQPLRSEPLAIPRLLREVITDYLNQEPDERFELTLSGTEDATDACIPGDERLIKRALRNAIDNAIKHNPQGATIAVSLAQTPDTLSITIADNGHGMNTPQLWALAEMLEEEYLGKGSLISKEETRVTLGKPRELFPQQNDVPGSPLPPLEYAASHYQEDVGNPHIRSQQRRRSAHHTAPEPPLHYDAPIGSEIPVDNPEVSSGGFTQTMPGSTAGIARKHGLGVPLIARIVITHGGELTLASQEGQGFRIIMEF